ncbi:HAD-IA family hydrolase [Conyzicola sp.]|uniref:HAD-IA family hydrolase n=1 Tax=Conyzicola sp. TaxID=1969404 RepID=UPI0039892D3A
MTTTIDCRAILFDMDGTLVDSTAVVERVWARFAERFGLDLADILASSHGRRMEDSIVRFGPEGVDVAAQQKDLSEFEFATTEGVVAVSGAPAFVRSLPPESIALVTSAGRDLAAMRMRSVDVPMPAVLVGAEDVTSGKPHPEPYLRAAAALGADPSDTVVFEDADAGIESGLAAGMRVIVVGDAAGEVARDLPRIRDYAQITATVTDGRITLALVE